METKQHPEEQVQFGRADIKYSLYLLRKNPIVLAGFFISVTSILLALLSPLLVNPTSWLQENLNLRLCWNNQIFNWHIGNVFDCSGSVFALGTDQYGRSLSKMIILAIPIDLQIALVVVLSAVVIGVLFGSIAAYVGGAIDETILRITDVFLAVPGILLAIVMIVVIGRSLPVLTFAVLITWWPFYVRLVRSQVLSEKEKPYVERLRAMGAGAPRILFRHVVPNSIYPVLVQATLDVGSVILTVSALTFIGLSPSPLLPELGNLANQGIQYIFTAPWLILFPGLTILIISLGFNLLGDGIRDIFDPRLRR
ncbi:MAG: ABC transporter permease [Candidatus Bathyarchaeia archaeon]|jgi:peptide/nickel transport system permease protein